MPVNIYRVTPENAKGDKHIALLCDDEWLLCSQLEALSAWLEQSTASLQPAEYVADVGFCWRRDASGGGSVLEPTAMRRMVELGMSLYLSEYGSFAGEFTKADNEDQSE